MIRTAALLAGLAVLGAPALGHAQTRSPAPPFSISPGQTHSEASRSIAKHSSRTVIRNAGAPAGGKTTSRGISPRTPRPGTAASAPGNVTR